MPFIASNGIPEDKTEEYLNRGIWGDGYWISEEEEFVYAYNDIWYLYTKKESTVGVVGFAGTW